MVEKNTTGFTIGTLTIKAIPKDRGNFFLIRPLVIGTIEHSHKGKTKPETDIKAKATYLFFGIILLIFSSVANIISKDETKLPININGKASKSTDKMLGQMS